MKKTLKYYKKKMTLPTSTTGENDFEERYYNFSGKPLGRVDPSTLPFRRCPDGFLQMVPDNTTTKPHFCRFSRTFPLSSFEIPSDVTTTTSPSPVHAFPPDAKFDIDKQAFLCRSKFREDLHRAYPDASRIRVSVLKPDRIIDQKIQNQYCNAKIDFPVGSATIQNPQQFVHDFESLLDLKTKMS